MVTFIPPYLGEEVKSNAERKVFEILQDIKMDTVYVLHSLGLPKHDTKSFGEIDFVVVCKRGVACFEVKGGRVACEAGQWIFTNGKDQINVKPEGPFAQVTGNMFSLAKAFKSYFHNNNRLQKIFTACGVIFPDIAFTSKSQEIIPEIIFDKTTSDITAYINNVFDYWERRSNMQISALSQTDMEAIIKFLRPDFCFVPLMRDSLEHVEKQILRFTDEQIMVVRGLYENNRLLIKGRAGTGKSLLAVDYAKKQIQEGKKVLYLTYNKNLVQSIKNQFEKTDAIKIINIHALFGEHVPVDGKNIKDNANEFFNEILPQKFSEYLLTLSDFEREAVQFDVLIMDEGQDILNPRYLESMDMILKNGFEKGQWAIFYDDIQNIYNKEFNDGLDLIKAYNPVLYLLTKNCRNTAKIGQYCAEVGEVEFSGFLQERGEEVQKKTYSDLNSLKNQLDTVVKDLQKGGIASQEIVFLSPKKYASSVLSQIDFKVNEFGDNFDTESKFPQYATIQGFKGLDAKIVLLVDVDKIFPKNFAQYMYVASSRARTLLYLFAPEKFWNKK